MPKKKKTKFRKTSFSLIGQKVIVKKTIPSGGIGMIKIKGKRKTKKARSTNGEIPEGNTAKIYNYLEFPNIFIVTPIKK